MRKLTKSLITGAVVAGGLLALATPAFATNTIYNFNTLTPAFQGGKDINADNKTVANHYAEIQFTNIQGSYKATAEVCQLTISAGSETCSGSLEKTDLVENPVYQIKSNYPVSGSNRRVFFRLRTNSITTDSVNMLGNTVAW